MPELPDLQVFSRNLTKLFAGKTLKKVKVVNGKKLKTTQKQFDQNIKGVKLKKIERVGKELYFQFSNGNVLAMHLMLRGQLYQFEETNDHKFTIIELLFNDGTGLALADYQGQATATLNPEERNAPDALSDEITVAFLKKSLQTRGKIKNVLLDQHVIRGIGNAYADEILWQAGISPFSVSNKIPEVSIKALHKAIKKVLTDAERSILKTHPDIISGEVRDFLKIHNAKRKTSPDGEKILIDKKGARKTYYTKEQRLFL
jgi:formamidopyrimidine-DNA glycosylase